VCRSCAVRRACRSIARTRFMLMFGGCIRVMLGELNS
jgi:hypothetical protein